MMRDEAGGNTRTRPGYLVARAAAIGVVAGAIAIAVGAAAIGHAADDQRVAPVTDSVVKKECGSCHIAFSPEFLPRRSWQKLVDTLSDHFGENASLGDAERKRVLDYLLANAGDGPKAGSEGRKFSASIRRTGSPRCRAG
jgi:hypothetical protein